MLLVIGENGIRSLRPAISATMMVLLVPSVTAARCSGPFPISAHGSRGPFPAPALEPALAIALAGCWR